MGLEGERGHLSQGDDQVSGTRLQLPGGFGRAASWRSVGCGCGTEVGSATEIGKIEIDASNTSALTPCSTPARKRESTVTGRTTWKSSTCGNGTRMGTESCASPSTPSKNILGLHDQSDPICEKHRRRHQSQSQSHHRRWLGRARRARRWDLLNAGPRCTAHPSTRKAVIDTRQARLHCRTRAAVRVRYGR